MNNITCETCRFFKRDMGCRNSTVLGMIAVPAKYDSALGEIFFDPSEGDGRYGDKFGCILHEEK